MTRTLSLLDKQNYVREFYPNVAWYFKKNYYYIVPIEGSGNTLGSGETLNDAWMMAFEEVYETYNEK